MPSKIWFYLILSVIGIGCLHAFTPGSMHFYHDTFRRLSYFPITIAAILFGIRGGLIIAGLTSIAFIPHLMIFMGKPSQYYYSELTEIILYLLAGFIIGKIAEKEKCLKEKYREQSEKLEKSYEKLHEGSRQLFDLEAQLRTSHKIAALGQLSASLVHEIKNPLSSIKGAAEIILDDYDVENSKRQFPEIIIKESNRLNNTVNEVLDFAKPETVEDQIDLVPLKEVISHISSLVGTQLQKKSIKMELEIEPSAENFFVDKDRLTQVLLNIILNAGEVEDELSKITLRASFKDKLNISIFDNGPGVPKEMRLKLFDPFVTGRKEGTGLGLSICKRIIESMAGELFLDDSYINGAKFCISIPVAAKKQLFSEDYEKTYTSNR